MALVWSKGQSPQSLARMLKAQKRVMERESAGALGRATTVLESAIRRRVFPARKVNQQDAPARRQLTLAGKSPVRTRVDQKAKFGRVSLTRHYTPARSKAVQSLFARFGLSAKLQRKGLVVKAGSWAGEFVPFNRDEGLQRWAQKRGQTRKNVVRLESPAIIQALQLRPGVRQSKPIVTGILRAGARKAFRA